MFIYWASFLWFPFAIAAIYLLITRTGWVRFATVAALLSSLPLSWARFVEPQLLLTQTTEINLAEDQADTRRLRVALFADTQYGLFPNALKMHRIVDRILSQDVDVVLMAGDWLLESDEEDIPSHVADLQRLTDANIPIYGVLGNHDIYVRYPPFSQKLYAALRQVGVVLVENRAYEVELAGIPLIISGTSDLWRSRQDFSFTDSLPENLPVLLLTHNPDTVFSVPQTFEYDLMLAGHTHGGQINLFWPRLMQRFIPTQYPFNEGLHQVPGKPPVFVTAGTGQTAIPMRFMRPPRIDILDLTLPVDNS